VEPEAQFKIDELAEATGLSRRTIHHYIAEGMIPRARGGAGPAAYYDEEHYLRLRLLTRLKGMGLSLSTIRDSLNDLSLEEMREVLELPESLDYRAIWAHVAMKRSGTPESFLVEEAELAESPPDMLRSRPAMSPAGRTSRLWRRRSATADTGDVLRQDISEPPSSPSTPPGTSPGTIRRDPEFVDGLAEERLRHYAEDSQPRTEEALDDSLERLEDKHHVSYMMSPDAFREPAPDPDDEPLHPEMGSQPWRRVRVSNDLEISYRPSSDPLTRKKLRHLLDFVHRLFRLERSSNGLSLDTETDPTGSPRRRGKRPQDPEEET
jgi:DNA-binding transcriptional MerR regulator